MSSQFLAALLNTGAAQNYSFGTAKRHCSRAIRSGTNWLAAAVEHICDPINMPPAAMPYGSTGGAEQVVMASQTGIFYQPINNAGFVTFCPVFTTDAIAICSSTTAYALQVIDTNGSNTVNGFLVGSNFNNAALTSPTNGITVGQVATGGVKCKVVQMFIRARCIDNVQNRGGDGFIGQATQAGGVDATGIGTSSFNYLMQNRLAKKLLCNGEWNTWHCTFFEEDYRYADTQRPFARSGAAIATGSSADVVVQSWPFFVYLAPNGSAHTWEYEVFFTFQATGSTPDGAITSQPNVAHVPHVPEAANIGAALSYARSLTAPGEHHSSIAAHCRNFFKSVGHDLKRSFEDGVGEAIVGAGLFA